MIDKLNFSGAGNIGSNVESPQSSIGDSLLTLGKYYTQKDSLEQEKLRQQEKDLYQRGRDAITDARLNKQEARQDKEQAANDLFYTEFAKGPQNKGGLYGELIAKESDKYAFTGDEIGLATKYKNDPLLARAAGQNALSDKIDWQLKAGEKADRFVASNVDDETRPEMYDRIGSLIASKGYTPPKELIIAADQARLAERTAEEAKAKLLDDQRAEIIKNQRSDLWKNVSYSGSGDTSTGTDSEGNQIQINTSKGASTQNRFNNSFNDDLSKGSNDITEAIAKNTKGATDTSKSLTSSDALKFYNKLVKEEGIDPSVAAAQIVNGISSKDPKWHQWLTDKEAKFSKDAISQLLPVLKETSEIKRKTDIANGVNIGVSSKEQAANNLLKTLAENDEVNLSKINADRAKLLLTPEERRIAKANQWLEREGILGKSSSEPGVSSSVDLSKYKDFNMDRYANKAIGVESSGNSKAQSPGGGSYYGIGQLNKESVESMGINWNDYKNNPDTQVTAFKNFTAKNVKDLEANGIPVNDFTVYIAHNQGVGGAKQILSGETPSKQVMLNMLNQGIDNSLPKIPKGKSGAGQIDINAVMADKTITADFLNKEYAPVDNYLRKFSKKFDTEIDKVITPGSTKLEVKGQGDNGYSVTPNRLDKNKENAKAYLSMTPDQRTELANSFNEKSGKNVEEVDALRSQILERNNSNKIQNLIAGSEPKDRLYDNKVLKTYEDKKAIQDSELSKSAFSRTFGVKEEVGKYGKIWNDSDSKKGSSLSKNVATLSSALDKDGFSSFEEVNKLYTSMPSGVDKDAVGELLNYKGMQGSQDWRDMKARQQYLEAGLTAASAIPIPAGLFARGISPVAEKVVAPIISGTVEKSAPLQIASDRAKLLLPDLNVGKGTSTVNNGLSLPDYKVGSRQWSNPNSVVATDKMFGRGVSDVIEMSAPEQRAIQAQRQAIASKKSLEETVSKSPKSQSTPDYFTNRKALEDTVDKIKSDTDAKMFWNGVLDARKNGQITDEKVAEIMNALQSKYTNINTRQMMESLEYINGKGTRLF